MLSSDDRSICTRTGVPIVEDVASRCGRRDTEADRGLHDGAIDDRSVDIRVLSRLFLVFPERTGERSF